MSKILHNHEYAIKQSFKIEILVEVLLLGNLELHIHINLIF